jgi:hypothetical protein
MFAKPRHFRDEIVEEKEVAPGPGQYNLLGGYRNGKTIREINDERKGSSFFKDGMNRFKRAVPQTEQVAPGTYDVGSANDALLNYGKKDRKTGAHMPDAAMTSLTKRGIIDAKDPVPGPGDYEVGVARAGGNDSRPMAAFASTSKGSSLVANTGQSGPTPGPGWYNVSGPGVGTSGGSKSAFKSGSARIGGNGVRQVKPPGPSYYNPKMPAQKRTFHLNVENKWC